MFEEYCSNFWVGPFKLSQYDDKTPVVMGLKLLTQVTFYILNLFFSI